MNAPLRLALVSTALVLAAPLAADAHAAAGTLIEDVELATITGSTTSGMPRPASSSQTVAMISREWSIPVLAAATGSPPVQ